MRPPVVSLQPAANTRGLPDDPTVAKRHCPSGPHGVTAVLCTVMAPSKVAVQAHVATSGPFLLPFPPPWLAHTPAGCGHGGTRYSSTSRSVHTWSVSPAAIAGVWGHHCLAEPIPLVGSGWGSA